MNVMVGDVEVLVRAAVLVVQQERLLVNRFGGSEFWFTPGGRVHAGEGSAAAAAREFLEETGVETGPLRLALVAENFFQTVSEQRVHALEFYYVVEKQPELPATPFPNRTDADVTFDWFPLEGLEAVDLRPAFLAALLPDLLTASTVRHITHQQA